MTTTIDRLNDERRASSDECMLLGAVAGTLDALHDELLEQPDRHDAIIDAVMDALASVRPGWVRTKREWEAPRITTYVRADKVAAGGTDAANAITVLAHGFGAWGHDSATAAAAAAREKYEGVRRGVDAVRSRAENAERERDEARAEVEAMRKRVDDPEKWGPPVGWLVRTEIRESTVYARWERDGYSVTHKTEHPTIYMCDTPADVGPAIGTLRGAIEWCEAQMTSAPTVGATDAGPDAPADDVEVDAVADAPESGAVPAAPVSGAEQSGGEAWADRIVGPREGAVVGSRANPPYGYEIDDSGDELVLLTVQSEAAIMLRICDLLDERRNATEIAETLNAEGHTSRSGTAWTSSSVRARILGSVDEWRGVSR